MKITVPGAALLALVLAISSPAFADKLSGARDEIERGCWWTASQTLTAIVEKDKDNAEAWALLSMVKRTMKDLDGAETAASNAIDLDDTAEHWKLLGRVSFARGEEAFVGRQASNVIKSWYADAEMKFKQALKRDEKDPDIRGWIGYAKEWQEYPLKARELYEQQIEMFPKVALGYLRLGSILATEANNTAGGYTEAAVAKRSEAIEVFRKGAETAGPDPDLLYNLGMAYEWAKERDRARETYVEAVEADPDLQKAWTRLYAIAAPAEALLHPMAIEALKKHKNNATAAMWSAFFLIQKERYEEALKTALPALKVHFELQGLHSQALAAGLKLIAREPDKALAAFEKIHEYYPFSGSAANNIGLYHRDRTRNYPESLKWYLKATEREPENQDLLNDTALIYLFYLKGQEKKALPMYLKTVALVLEEGQKPIRGFWDACENLCKYYWEFERDPEKVLYYYKLRSNPYAGVDPYTKSRTAYHYKQLADRELKK